MSNGGPAMGSFENLTHSGLAKFKNKEKDGPTLNIDVFGGSTRFVVFLGQGAKPFNLSLPSLARATFVRLLRRVQANPTPARESIQLNGWDAENRKVKQEGHVAIVIDDNLALYIEIGHQQINGKQVFQIKPDFKWDFSQTSMTDKDIFQSLIDYLISVLSLDSVVAERLSSQKRPRQGGGGGGNWGGGNRSGGNSYGGGNSGGGYNGGGGQRQQPQSNTFDVEDDIAI